MKRAFGQDTLSVVFYDRLEQDTDLDRIPDFCCRDGLVGSRKFKRAQRNCKIRF